MQCHGPAFVENNMGKSSETYKVSATNTKLHTPVHMPVFGYIFFIFPAHRKLKLGSLHDASISWSAARYSYDVMFASAQPFSSPCPAAFWAFSLSADLASGEFVS